MNGPLVTLTMDDARAVEANHLTLVPDAEVVPSTDPRRRVLITAMSRARRASGIGWDEAHALQFVSVAVPAFAPAIVGDLLRRIPFAGSLLADVVQGFEHPTVFLAPAVEQVPHLRVSVLDHEFGHHLQVEDGGVAWCIAYGLHPEHRVMAAEGPCYACDVAWRTWCEGHDPDATADAVAEGLRAYGANDALVRDARRQLAGHVLSLRDGLCVPVRTTIESVRVRA